MGFGGEKAEVRMRKLPWEGRGRESKSRRSRQVGWGCPRGAKGQSVCLSVQAGH